MKLSLKIANPYEGVNGKNLVQTRLPDNVFNYFFLEAFAGEHGLRFAIVSIFFQALYEECQKRGIPARWEPDNISQLAEILSNLNFSCPTTKPKSTRRAQTHQ